MLENMKVAESNEDVGFWHGDGPAWLGQLAMPASCWQRQEQ